MKDTLTTGLRLVEIAGVIAGLGIGSMVSLWLVSKVNNWTQASIAKGRK